MNVKEIARVCHDANMSLCDAIGDRSQMPWDSAPEWQRQSSIKGVEFALANPLTTPEGQHLQWMADKVKDGWKHGHAKDPCNKTHPCLVPYSDLPEFQRKKDELFLAIVRALQD